MSLIVLSLWFILLQFIERKHEKGNPPYLAQFDMIILCSCWSQYKLPESLQESSLGANKAKSIIFNYN